MDDATGLAALGEQIERLTNERVKPPTKVDLKLPQGHILYMNTDGQFIPHDVGPGYAHNQFDTIEDALTYIDQKKIDDKGAVFVSRSSIVVLPDVSDQREHAYVPLAWTEQYSMLVKKETQGLTQQDFVLLLRTTYANAVPPGANLYKIFSNIKWAVGASGERVIEHGRDNYGKSVNAAVESGVGGTLPDEVVLAIPVFELRPRETFPIRCAIDIRTANQCFSLIPMPQETTRAMLDAQGNIIDTLQIEEGPPVYRGTPNQG